jgi:hypothetical protein
MFGHLAIAASKIKTTETTTPNIEAFAKDRNKIRIPSRIKTIRRTENWDVLLSGGEGGSDGDNVKAFGTVTAVIAIWARCGDADLGGRRGNVLTTRRTFKLEFHRRKRVQESSMAYWPHHLCRAAIKNDSSAIL